MERWRSRRATVTLTLYLTILGAVMYLLYRLGLAVLNSQFGSGFDPASAGPVLGRFLVEGLLFFVLLLVLFVGPGYAAAQISGERERRTLTLLQVTLLRPVQIVLGKLGAAVAWLSLLVLAAVPLGAVAFFLGGIGIVDLLRSGVLLVVIGVSIAGIGLGISSLTRKTTGSIVLTYGLVLMLVVGTLFLAGAEAVFRSTRGERVGTPIALYLNPFFGLADAVNAARFSESGFGGLPSPLGVIAEVLPGSPAVGGDEPVQVGPGVFVEEAQLGGGSFEVRAEAAPAVVAEPDLPPPPVPGPPPPQTVPEGLEQPPGVIGQEEFVVLGGDAAPFQPVLQQQAAGRRPVWLIVMGIYLLMGGLGVLLATRRLAVTEARSRALPQAPPGVVPAVGPAVSGAPGGSWEGPPR